MNSQLNALRVNDFIEDRIRAAAESRSLPEYRRDNRAPRVRRSVGRRWARAARV